MRFSRPQWDDEPEINFIPLIDVLLVLLIFLTATTTFARYSELTVNLPQADAPQAKIAEIAVDVTADGHYAINGEAAAGSGLVASLQAVAAGQDDPLVVIYADAQASHQSVIDVMQAARLAGLGRLSFAARQPAGR